MNQPGAIAMSNESTQNNDCKMTSIFERFLSLWVVFWIVAGVLLGKIAPGLARYLDGLAIYVKGAPVYFPATVDLISASNFSASPM
jgi:ACR3 family arsenite efflux pump ArsB